MSIAVRYPNRLRSVRRAAWIAPAAAAVALVTACGSSGTRHIASNESPVAQIGTSHTNTGNDPAKATDIGTTSAGMVLNVVNNSSHDLRWVGDGSGPDPSTNPKDIIPAGDTDRIVWHGKGLQLEPTWQVVGTQANVYPRFGVPVAGFNACSCTVDDISKTSPVGMTHCDIGSGWDPDAHVTFSNK